jgi:hypothetical protein
LYITDNASLTDLTAFADNTDGFVLTTVSDLVIRNNASIQNLAGLDNVTGISGSLSIYDCTNLNTLRGFGAFPTGLGALVIVGGVLPHCLLSSGIRKCRDQRMCARDAGIHSEPRALFSGEVRFRQWLLLSRLKKAAGEVPPFAYGTRVFPG